MGVGAVAVLHLQGGKAIVRRMALISSVGAAGAFAYAMASDEYDGASWFAIAIIVMNLVIVAGVLSGGSGHGFPPVEVERGAVPA